MLSAMIFSARADDKIDVAFTISEKRGCEKTHKNIKKFVTRNRPTEAKRFKKRSQRSDPSFNLDEILQEYCKHRPEKGLRQRLSKFLSEPGYRKLSLYVLTDGNYE